MVMTTPSPQQVGREFVRQYYTVLNEAPELLHRFYSSGSMFVRGGMDPSGQSEEPVIGQLEINKQIHLLSFKDCHTKIRQVDSQSTIANGVVVQVTGELSNNGEMMRRFMQTFVLAPQTAKKYYVHNDIFRYQDEVYQDLTDTEAEEHHSQTMQQQAYQTQQEVEVKTSSTTLNINYYQSNQNQTEVIITQQEEEKQVVVSTTVVQAEDSAPSIKQNKSNGNLHSSSSSASSAAPSEVNPVKEEEKVSFFITESIAEQEQLTLVIETSNDLNFAKEEESVKEVLQVESSIEVPITVKTNSWAKIITHKTDSNLPNSANNSTFLSSSLASAGQTYVETSNSLKRQKENKKVLTSKPAQQNGALPKSLSNKSRMQNNNLNDQQEKLLEAGSRDPQQNENQMHPQLQQQHNSQQKPQNTGQANQGQNGIADMDDIDKRFGHYPDGQQVFVGNLSQDINETELRQFFVQFGKVIEVRINTNTKQQNGRRLANYGFVVFEDKQVVDNLLGATKSKNLTYNNDKGGDYRLNVEEKRARMGRQSGVGLGNKSRGTRSSSNSSKGAGNQFAASNTKKTYPKSNNSNYFGDGRKKEVTDSYGDAVAGVAQKNNFRRS